MFIEAIIVLLLLSLLVFALPQRFGWAFTMLMTGTGAVLACIEAVGVLATGEAAVFSRGVGTVLGGGAMDPLSAVFVIIASLSAVSVVLYSRGYLKSYQVRKPKVQLAIHKYCMAAVFFSILLVLTMRTGFGFLFSWELMTVSSFLLVLFYGEKAPVRRAAMNYLILMHVGFVFLLIGFVTVGISGLPASLDSLPAYFANHSAMPLFVVFLIGFGMKAGLFPLHIWLPEADPAAPGHISAYMSGVMTKMGVFGVLRVVSSIGEGLWDVGLVLFIAGVVTAVWGVVLAVMQGDMRKKLAYSTMENIGVIFLGLGIGLMGKATGSWTLALLAIGGALLHVVTHCFMKHLLFMGVGNVISATGQVRIDVLGGLDKRMPVTSVLFAVGVTSICALPPLGGFVSEFMIYLGMFEGVGAAGAVGIISILGIMFMALTGGLVLMAFAKLYGVVFLGHPRSARAAEAREVSGYMLAAMAVPLAAVVLIGFMPFGSISMAFSVAGATFGIPDAGKLFGTLSADFAGLAGALLFLIGFTVLLWIVRRAMVRRRPQAEGPTWGCGFTSPTVRMQYTGESFSDGLGRISGRFVKNTGVSARLSGDEIFPEPHNFLIGHKDKMGEFLSRWWVAFLRMINSRFSQLRSGKINHYILYALLFIVLIFLLTILDLI